MPTVYCSGPGRNVVASFQLKVHPARLISSAVVKLLTCCVSKQDPVDGLPNSANGVAVASVMTAPPGFARAPSAPESHRGAPARVER